LFQAMAPSTSRRRNNTNQVTAPDGTPNVVLVTLKMCPDLIPSDEEFKGSVRQLALRKHQKSVPRLSAKTLEAQEFRLTSMEISAYVLARQEKHPSMTEDVGYMRDFLTLLIAKPTVVIRYEKDGKIKGDEAQQAELRRAFGQLIRYNVERLEGEEDQSEVAEQLEVLKKVKSAIFIEPGLVRRTLGSLFRNPLLPLLLVVAVARLLARFLATSA